jgi:hypothetical protein
MNTMIDELARGAGAAQNRRVALKTLGATALAASCVAPLTAQAKQGRKNKNKSKNKAKKLCQRQIGQCEAAVRGICAGSADCEADLIPCCLELGQCDATNFIACVSGPSEEL